MSLEAPNPLLSTLGRALERLFVQALALDPDTRAGLARLHGRSVELQLAAPQVALRITVEGESLRVGPADPGSEPDLSLRATAGALLAQLLPAREQAAPAGRLKISGDAELARVLRELVRGFDPDLDALFARTFGDVLGVQIARALRGALAAAVDHGGRLLRDGADYLSEERRDLVSRVEQAGFGDEVDTLREDVDRLAARIARLRARRTGP